MMRGFMPSNKTKPQKKRPREIVVYCEGFGAGPGMGWFVELSFVENNGGFSVFKRTDEDPVEEESGDAPTPGRRLATVHEPLTWKQVVQFVSRRKSVKIYDDSGSVEVRGVEPWQCDVIASALYRRGFTSFLLGLPDDEIRALHGRFEGLLSEEADETLTELAEGVEEAGLLGKSVVEVAEFVGVSDPCSFESLVSAIRPFRDAMQAYSRAREVAQFITEHRNNPVKAPFSKLTEYPRLESIFHRAELFAMWLRTEPKPEGGKIGTIKITGSTTPILSWILAGHAIDVFEALDEGYRSELEQFAAWFLKAPTTGKQVYRGHPMGRGLHEARAQLEEEVEEAARQLGLPVPNGAATPPSPTPNEQSL
jgi:hypothetical protein